MNILVSGASGFVGQHLLPHLIAQGHNIIGLIHKNTPQYRHENLSYIAVDLTDVSDVLHQLESVDPALIIDLAAIIDYSKKNREETIAKNVIMTNNLVNWALSKNAQYLKLSSIAALGEANEPHQIIDENNVWDDDLRHSSYAMAKYLSELEVWRGFAEGLDVAVLNPGIILGRGVKGALSDNFSRTITEPQKYYTHGKSLYVDVMDVVQAISTVVQQWQTGAKYIIGAENITFAKLLFTAADSLGFPRPHRELKSGFSNLFRVLFNLKSKLQGKDAFLSKENVQNLFAVKNFNTDKFTKMYPDFGYTELSTTLKRIKKAASDNDTA